MKDKKSFLEIAILTFISIIVLVTLAFGLVYLIDSDLGMTKTEILMTYVGAILFVYMPILVFLFLFTFSFKLGKKVVNIEQGHIDFNKDKTYFRDILDEYSILELAYINNMQTLEKKDVAATLLSLELKKVIKLQNNEIIEINSKPVTNAEDYILRKCISGKLNLDRMDILTDIVRQDSLKSGLIEKETNIIKDIFLMIIKTNIFALLAFMLLAFTSGLYYEYENIFTMLLGAFALLLNVLSGYRMIYLFSYIYHKLRSFKLTNKGKEIKNKLDGLNMYIKDFSTLHDDDKKSLTLWEDYLIYSVMFGENKKIISDMSNLLQIDKKLVITRIKNFLTVFVFVILGIVLVFFLSFM